MDDDVCPICIEAVDYEFKPYNCIHSYHKECFLRLKNIKGEYNSICSLCRSKKKKFICGNNYTNYTFNNFIDTTLDIQKYINKWSKKECLDNNHKLILETLGDWYMSSSRDLKMSFRMMHITCTVCNKDQLIK